MSRYILFLHGYEGTSHSYKAQCIRQQLEHYEDVQLICPQLTCYPQSVWVQIQDIMEAFAGQIIGVVGASLGGLFAARTSVTYDRPAVLINPVSDISVVPRLIGEHIHPHTHECFRLTHQHVQQLERLMIEPEQTHLRQWLMLQTGDEVLDFRQALGAYPYMKQTIECGGHHGFAGFARYAPAIVRFFLTNKD